MARRPYPAVPILTGALVALNHWLIWVHRELTDAISTSESLNARLEAIIAAIGSGVAAHASSHVSGGSDEIDGDALAIGFTPAEYTPTSAELAGHLEGIDDKFADQAADIAAAQSDADAAQATADARTTFIDSRLPSYSGTSSTGYVKPWERITPDATEGTGLWPMPRAGTARNLRFKWNTAGATGGRFLRFIVRLNGVDTVLTVDVPSNSAAEVVDSTHSFSFVAGDRLSISVAPDGGTSIASPGTNGTITVELAFT